MSRGSKGMPYVDIMALHPGVTGSLNLVIVKLPNGRTIKFIVDCGLFQERSYGDLNQSLPFKAEEISFAIVTHNHVDHIGRLPYLVRKGFFNKIYATKATALLMPNALKDSCKVLQGVAKRNGKRPLYNEEDVSRAIALINGCDFYKPIKVDENIKITFLINGHLVGAALVLVQISYPECESINLLFTGDWNNKNMFFDVPILPDWIFDLPITVIQESTYGDMDKSEMKPCFKENVLECVRNGGEVLAPVFSLGRSQEILYEVKCMQDSGELSTDIPVFLDGKLAIRYTNMYLEKDLGLKESMKDFLPRTFSFVDKSNRDEVATSGGAKIVLTTSGMGTYGPAQFYIPKFISRRDALIQFTGYTAEGTLGDRLKKSNNGEIVEIAGTFEKKYAKVEYTKEYSAHAKADEMIAFLQQFNNLKLVLLNHGEPEVKEIFAKRIVNTVNAKNVGILGRRYFYRVNAYGLVKSLSTKFE